MTERPGRTGLAVRPQTLRRYALELVNDCAMAQARSGTRCVELNALVRG